jgi:hypothetical protein
MSDADSIDDGERYDFGDEGQRKIAASGEKLPVEYAAVPAMVLPGAWRAAGRQHDAALRRQVRAWRGTASAGTAQPGVVASAIPLSGWTRAGRSAA